MGARSCDLVIVTKLTVNPSSSLDRSSATPKSLTWSAVVLDALAMSCSSRGCPGVTVRIGVSPRMRWFPHLWGAGAGRFLRWGAVDDPSRSGVRLAEALASLSLGIDLGFGQPMEHVLRQCRITMGLCDLLGVDDQTVAAAYYSGLLVNVGCPPDAHEQVQWFGDDISFKSIKYVDSKNKLEEVTRMVRMLGAGAPPLHRLRVAFAFALGGHRDVEAMIA